MYSYSLRLYLIRCPTHIEALDLVQAALASTPTLLSTTFRHLPSRQPPATLALGIVLSDLPLAEAPPAPDTEPPGP